MFDRLIESRAQTQNAGGSTVMSVAAHAAIIAAAVVATSQLPPARVLVPEIVRPVYFPPQASIPSAPASPNGGGQPLPIPTFQAFIPPAIDVKPIGLDLGPIVSKPVDLPTGSFGRADAGDSHGGEQSGAFNAAQVEKQVSLISGSGAPVYPESLRSAGIEGEVVAVFVVGIDGRAETDSVRFVRSANVLFQDAVRAALGRMRFVPAEIGGRRVRQLVQMPFVFTLNR